MTFLIQLIPGLLALSLAASLAACADDEATPAQPGVVTQAQVVANDCRAPNAQTAQRGCRPGLPTANSLASK